MTEVGAGVQSVEQGGCGCLDLVENLCGGDSGVHVVRFGDMGDDTIHWEGLGQIPSQGGQQADKKTA